MRSATLLRHNRYYRDPAQPAPQSEEVEEGRGERVALDPEALLREAEENVENLDEVSPSSCLYAWIPLWRRLNFRQ